MQHVALYHKQLRYRKCYKMRFLIFFNPLKHSILLTKIKVLRRSIEIATKVDIDASNL